MASSGLSVQQLTALAREHHIPFHTVLDRYERGFRGSELVRSKFVSKAETWLSTQEVAQALFTTTSNVLSINHQYPEWCRRRPWSKNARTSRGCGTLFWRVHVNQGQEIRRNLRLSVSQTAKLMHACAVAGYEIRRKDPR